MTYLPDRRLRRRIAMTIAVDVLAIGVIASFLIAIAVAFFAVNGG